MKSVFSVYFKSCVVNGSNGSVADCSAISVHCRLVCKASCYLYWHLQCRPGNCRHDLQHPWRCHHRFQRLADLLPGMGADHSGSGSSAVPPLPYTREDGNKLSKSLKDTGFQSTSPHEGRQQKVTIFLPVAIPRLVIIYNFSYFHIQKFHFLNFLCFKKASLLVRIPWRFYACLPFAQLTNYGDVLFQITLFPWICLEEKRTVPDADKTFLIRPEIPPSTSHPETKIQCDRFPVLPIHSHDRNNPVRSLLQ